MSLVQYDPEGDGEARAAQRDVGGARHRHAVAEVKRRRPRSRVSLQQRRHENAVIAVIASTCDTNVSVVRVTSPSRRP